MLGTVVMLLLAAFSVESFAVHDLHERLAHGRQLKIYLPKSSEKLEFSPADDPSKTFLYWERGRSRLSKGRVSGTGSDRRWYIDRVTYEDQGTYIQRDFWNKEISTVRVVVTPRHNYVKCVAGENLHISLEGINLADAFLSFSNENTNVTLVRDGSRVSQDIPEYWDRVKTHSMNIEIKHVNYSDEGRYMLKDRRDRLVSVTRMDLTDHHEHTSGNPFLALLLLLGIPVGVCCCCRKKIFKKKPPPAVLQTTPQTVHPPPSNSGGPCPPYNAPGQPGAPFYYNPNANTGPNIHPPPPVGGPGQWNGPPPSPGFNPAYPPQNAMIPPQQWSGPPPGLYPPAASPMGYTPPAPLMYSSPPPQTQTVPENMKEEKENVASSAADPLLNTAPETQSPCSPLAPVPPSTEALSSSGGAYTFQIDDGKSSTNFL